MDKETIAKILVDNLCYAYCDNCGNELYEDNCDGCHRKYQNWKLSRETADSIAEEICHKTKSKWVKVHGYVTPGGDPVWQCPKCGKGIHVYGIEHGTYGADIAEHQWVSCPNCGTEMDGEEWKS